MGKKKSNQMTKGQYDKKVEELASKMREVKRRDAQAYYALREELDALKRNFNSN